MEEELKALMNDVARMRTAQKNYFAFAKTADGQKFLIESKAREKIVDDKIAALVAKKKAAAAG